MSIYDYNNQFFKLPLKTKSKIEDILQYKGVIIKLRKASKNKNICKISYLKKTTNQIKQYYIIVSSYYIRFDTRQTIIMSLDIKDRKRIKTFMLNNIQNVQITDQVFQDYLTVNLN